MGKENTTYIQQHMSDLADRSGYITSEDPLMEFIYILLTKHLTAGEMEDIMLKVQNGHIYRERQYFNGYIAEYAADIAARLTDQDKEDYLETEESDDDEKEDDDNFEDEEDEAIHEASEVTVV